MKLQCVHLIVVVICTLLLSKTGVTGEKKLMHCFAFTPIESAPETDWETFYKATDELPSKIDGLNKVWYGKLRRPMRLYYKTGSGDQEYKQRVRKWAVCMEMEDITALEKYADHPAHAKWEEAYFKIRQRGTTTFDILGQ